MVAQQNKWVMYGINDLQTSLRTQHIFQLTGVVCYCSVPHQHSECGAMSLMPPFHYQYGTVQISRSTVQVSTNWYREPYSSSCLLMPCVTLWWPLWWPIPPSSHTVLVLCAGYQVPEALPKRWRVLRNSNNLMGIETLK